MLHPSKVGGFLGFASSRQVAGAVLHQRARVDLPCAMPSTQGVQIAKAQLGTKGRCIRRPNIRLSEIGDLFSGCIAYFVAPYRAILRYYRCDTPYRYFLTEVSTLPCCDTPSLVLGCAQAHLCDTRFCNVSHDDCAIPPPPKKKKTSTKEFCDTIAASIGKFMRILMSWGNPQKSIIMQVFRPFVRILMDFCGYSQGIPSEFA